MAGEEKFGYFRLSEGTEGEDGGLSSGSSWSCVSGGENWLLIVLVLFVKKVAKSSAVIDVVGDGEGGQRRELNVLKRLRISGALLILLWKCDDLAVNVEIAKN